MEGGYKTLQAGKLVIFTTSGITFVKTVAAITWKAGQLPTESWLLGNSLRKLIMLVYVCWYLLLLERLPEGDELRWELVNLQRWKEEFCSERFCLWPTIRGFGLLEKPIASTLLTSGGNSVTQSYWTMEICLSMLPSFSNLLLQGPWSGLRPV